jgi:hypothetical protein
MMCQPTGALPGRGSKEARRCQVCNQACPPRVLNWSQEWEFGQVAAVMIGIDPHKWSHTAVAINAAEEPLDAAQ